MNMPVKTKRHVHREKTVRQTALLLFVLLFGFWPFASHTPVVHAQLSEFAQTLRIDVQPRFPKPQDTVRIEIESFNTDLNSATITWQVDGRTVKQGVGLKEITVRIGNIGEQTIVTITANTLRGVLQETLVINPAAIDLLWEARGYTPPFYRGRARLAPDADIVVSAEPDMRTAAGRIIPKEELVYTWRRNGEVLGSLSGTGKSTVVLDGPRVYQESRIEVIAESLDGSVTGRGILRLLPEEPKLLFYEDRPLLGTLFNKAIGETFSVAEAEMSFAAHPFFFSAESPRDQALLYAWSINNEPVKNPDIDASILTVRPFGNGFSNLRAEVRHRDNIFQSAKHAFRLNFSGPTQRGSAL